jgi:hypothetical protein
MQTCIQVRRRVSSVLAFVAVVALLAAGFTKTAWSQSSSSPVRIMQAVDENNLVRLSGNTRPEANIKNDRGPVADSFNVDHMLLLLQRSPQQEKSLEAFIDSLNNRKSANFHHWLTAEEFGERFGVSQQDIDTLRGWLESHGFHVNQVYTSHMMLDVSATAGQLRQAFHTSVHNLDVDGEAHIANMNDPMIPAALAPVVKGFFSLHDFKPHKMLKPVTQYTFAGCASSTDAPTEPGTCYAMTPADNWTIYNLNPLFNAGITGQGQTIALVEDTDSYGTDWQSYRNAFGLTTAYPQGSLVTTHPGGCTDPGTNSADSEADLDVEVASAIAPNATIELISCEDGTVTFGGLTALQGLVNGAGPYPGVVSVSYGVCEVLNGSAGNASFFDTYQQAAAEGISVFGASGDEGPSSCSVNFGTASGSYPYDVTSLGVSGWTDTPYNVAVGGTDFEDTYNSKTGQNGGNPLSTYWGATNGSNYGSALSYVPEIPWNDSCASALIAEVANGSFLTYSTSGACGKSPWDTTSGYLSTGAGSGGASNCATGAAANSTDATDQYDYLVTSPDCQGYPKPSWQAAYGVPNDGVRDIPDVSMFAANGVWGHFETVCWSDPAYTADGSASCAGAPSTWSGFGGTSVASPTMAAVQALVNQKTGEMWGNPNPIYYQIAQGEYGSQGGSFAGSTCNASGTGGPGGSCVFNDVTQGDIDLACETNGTVEAAHCYDYVAGSRGKVTAYGVDSTDNVTGTVIINGGTGYTSAPTCTIAGPTNNNPYISPTGSTLFAGGTQATCTAAVSASSTTAVWSVGILSANAADGMTVIVGSQSIALTGASTTAIASALAASINSGSTVATATVSSSTVTVTAKTAGYAGNFNVSFGGNVVEGVELAYATNTTLGQGPNYVSGITITAAGSGYQPETPITLSGGGGSGALAVANTTPGTASQSYQPAYPAAPGYDMATGLGSVNAYNLVCNSAWGSTCQTVVNSTTAVSSSLDPSTYGQSVSFTATVTGNSPTGTVQFNIDGNAFGSPVALSSGSATSGSTNSLAAGIHTVTAVYSGDTNNNGSTGTLSGGQVVNMAGAGTITVSSSSNPSTYGQSVTFTASIPGDYNFVSRKNGRARSQDVTGTVTWSSNTGCGTTNITSGNPGTATCITTSLPVGGDLVVATYSGDANHNSGSGSTTQNVNQVTSSTSVVSSLDPSVYGQSMSFTATVTGSSPTGTVQFNIDGSAFGSPVALVSGSATSGSTNSLAAGTHTVTSVYSGDTNNSGGTGTLSGGQVVNLAGAGTITVSSSVNPSNYQQSVTFTASIPGDYNFVSRRNGRARSQDVTGTVSWSSNTNCGTTNVTSGNPGTATCTTTSLPVGSDSVVATYSGDSNHNPGSGSTTQNVNQATGSTTVTSSLDPSVYGQSVNFTATVTGSSPTGTVQFNIDGSAFGSAVALVSGIATSGSTNSLAAGIHTVTAVYSGDTNNSGSTGTLSGGQVVNLAGAGTITVSSSANPSNYQQSVTFTVSIPGDYNFVSRRNGRARSQDVTGTVTWSSNTGCNTTNVTSGNPGTATCITTTLPVGNDAITASYSGDANHNPGTGTLSGGQQVNPLTQTITAAPPASAYRGDSFTVSASGGASGNPLEFASSGSCTNTGATYTMGASGSCTGTITQAGNGNYSAATPYTWTTTIITKLATPAVSLSGAPTSAVGGSTFVVTAAYPNTQGVPAPVPTITAAGSCSVGAATGSGTGYQATVTMTKGSGTCTTTAKWAANFYYAAATASEKTTGQLITPTTSFTGAPATAPGGSTFTVTATSNESGTYASTPTITGTGSCMAGTVTGTGSGSYESTITMTEGSGACTTTAKWAATIEYPAVNATQKTTAERITPTTGFSGAPATAVEGSTFTVTATSNESGTYASTPTITATGVCTAGTVTSSGSGTYESTITITAGSGTCTTTAKWAETIAYAASTITQKTTAERTAPTVSLTGAPSSAPIGSQFTVTASSNETGSNAATPTITVAGGDCTVGSVTSTGPGSYQATVTMTKATGTCTTTAKWLQTIAYSAASATQTTTAGQ